MTLILEEVQFYYSHADTSYVVRFRPEIVKVPSQANPGKKMRVWSVDIYNGDSLETLDERGASSRFKPSQSLAEMFLKRALENE